MKNKPGAVLNSIIFVALASFANAAHASFDESVNELFKPIAKAMSDIVFFSVPIAGSDAPVIVMLLVSCGLFFTLYLGFINVRGFGHALKIVRGDYSKGDNEKTPGEVSHFQALTTAVSGTVGVGNVAHVAIVISTKPRRQCFRRPYVLFRKRLSCAQFSQTR